MTTQSHIKLDDRNAIPQSKFSYSFSGMKVIIKNESTQFYHFLTSLCALLGGAYTFVQVCHSNFIFFQFLPQMLYNCFFEEIKVMLV